MSSKVEPPLPSSLQFISCVCSTNLWLIVEFIESFDITTSVVEFLFDLPTEFSGSNQTPIHPSVGTSLAEFKPLLASTAAQKFKSPYVETTVGYRQRIGVMRYEISRDFAEN